MQLADLQIIRPVGGIYGPPSMLLRRLARLARVYATIAIAGAALTLLVLAADWRVLIPVLAICTATALVLYRARDLISVLHTLRQWMSSVALVRADIPASPRVALELSDEEWAHLMVGSIFGARYRIESVLLTEGPVSVYKATEVRDKDAYVDTDPHNDRPIALTLVPVRAGVFPPVVFERVRDEVRRLRSLDTPNVLRPRDAGETEGMHFVATEFVRSYTLADLLHEVPEQQMSVRVVVGIARQIAHGLQALHTRGVIHGELRPKDLFINESDEVKLLNLGLPRMKRIAEEVTYTQRLEAMGVPPDELAFVEYDTQTDITSLGMLIAEMLIGRQPWSSSHPAEILRLHHRVAPPISLRPDIGRGLNAVIMRCFEDDPERRFAVAGEIGAALDAVDLDEGSAALRA
jgi:serine/threonine protein kinase